MKGGDHISDYIIERALGEGGMGEVYLARHTVLDQQVAIKILDPEVARKSGVRERFIQEANIQAKLKHPNIVQVLTATKTDGGTPALIMEYVDGKSLAEVLELRGALPVEDALKVMQQVLSAVGYAHKQGVIHRDLKPSNVMVMASGEVKVTDFGIAKVLGSAKLTRTGTAMGSAHYMSPEQIRRPEAVDARSDVYSLGCVFYEVLTGRPPFGDGSVSGTESDFEIKEGHVRGQIPQLGSFRQGVPAWLERLVMQLLAKEPDDRPQSCEQILAQLAGGERLVGGKRADKHNDGRVGKTVLIPAETSGSVVQALNKDRITADGVRGYKKLKPNSRSLLGIALCVVVCVSVVLVLGKGTFKNFIDADVTENTGKFVINPQFDEASNFSEGLAKVRIGDVQTGKYGFIDKEGRMIIATQFDDAESFSEGLALVRVGNWEAGKRGYINKEGKMVIALEFDYAMSFSEGLALVRVGNWETSKYGYINKEGKIVIVPQFDEARPFFEGLAPVRIGDDKTGKWGFINKKGEMIISPQFDKAYPFFEGLAGVRLGDDKTGKWGFINKKGEMIVSPQFDDAFAFFEGLAPVRIGDDTTGKFGFINKKGEITISPQFDLALLFFEGLAPVRIGDDKTGKWGFINKKGETIIPPQFDAADPFFEGLAAIRIGDDETGKWGFINKDGKIVINPQFAEVEFDIKGGFRGGLVAVRVGDGKTGKKGFIARR
jgi:serine/threonine protein kinase